MVQHCLKYSEKACIREVLNFPIATPKPWVAGSNPPAPAKQNSPPPKRWAVLFVSSSES